MRVFLVHSGFSPWLSCSTVTHTLIVWSTSNTAHPQVVIHHHQVQLRAYDTLLRTEQPAYPAPARNRFLNHLYRLVLIGIFCDYCGNVMYCSSAIDVLVVWFVCSTKFSYNSSVSPQVLGLIAQPLLLPQRLELKQPKEWFDEYVNAENWHPADPIWNQQVIILISTRIITGDTWSGYNNSNYYWIY